MSYARPFLSHLGIFAIDLEVMEKFYTEVFGLLVTDRGVGAVFHNNLVFMSGSADQHHQFVLASGRPKDAPSTIMQLSFRVNNLDELRAIKKLAESRGGHDFNALNHGNAWSIYFKDPEDNLIEVYIDTPFHTPQPCGHPLDLSLSDEEQLEVTKKLVDSLPGSCQRSDYVQQMAERLGEQKD